MNLRTTILCSMVAGTVAATSANALADPPSFIALGLLPGNKIAESLGISADGNYAVGYMSYPNANEPYQWSNALGAQGLGFLPGVASPLFHAPATGANEDGSVVVGRCYMTHEGYEAFRWSATTGIVGLGDLPGGIVHSGAEDVNADGTVVVGWSSSGNSGFSSEAFRWEQGVGMQGLGSLPGRQFHSRASSVSADGIVVVGYSEPYVDKERAFRRVPLVARPPVRSHRWSTLADTLPVAPKPFAARQ